MNQLHGFNHWWLQRATAVLLIVFSVILGYNLILMNTVQSTILQVFFNFANDYSYLIGLLSIVLIVHIKYGIEEIIYDYVTNEKIKLLSSILMNLLLIRMINEILLYLFL